MGKKVAAATIIPTKPNKAEHPITINLINLSADPIS